ncbi:hypothetical protein N2152v2_006824 [Parachlorella kessleri]
MAQQTGASASLAWERLIFTRHFQSLPLRSAGFIILKSDQWPSGNWEVIQLQVPVDGLLLLQQQQQQQEAAFAQLMQQAQQHTGAQPQLQRLLQQLLQLVQGHLRSTAGQLQQLQLLLQQVVQPQQLLLEQLIEPQQQHQQQQQQQLQLQQLLMQQQQQQQQPQEQHWQQQQQPQEQRQQQQQVLLHEVLQQEEEQPLPQHLGGGPFIQASGSLQADDFLTELGDLSQEEQQVFDVELEQWLQSGYELEILHAAPSQASAAEGVPVTITVVQRDPSPADVPALRAVFGGSAVSVEESQPQQLAAGDQVMAQC